MNPDALLAQSLADAYWTVNCWRTAAALERLAADLELGLSQASPWEVEHHLLDPVREPEEGGRG